MERYELVEGSSAKFWEVGVDGTTLSVRFGRIGTSGQTKEKTFDSAALADKEMAKLVKEKTGKGYALTGEVTPAPATAKEEAPKPHEVEPEPAAVVEATVEPVLAEAGPDTTSEEIQTLLDHALPTRSTPRGALDPEQAWKTLNEILAILRDHAKEKNFDSLKLLEDVLRDLAPKQGGGALGWIKSKLGGGSDTKSGMDAATASGWIERIQSAAWEIWVVVDSQGPTSRSGSRAALTEFARWLVATTDPETLAAVIDKHAGEVHKRSSGYERLAWGSAFDVAFRDAVTAAPPAFQDQLLELLTEAAASQPDWRKRASFAFILADDRPVQHELKPLAVLEAAAGAGEDPGALLHMMPLIAEAPPSAVARWRAKRSYYFYFSYTELAPQEVLAATIRSAERFGETPAPTLEWLLSFAHNELRTTIAETILAVGGTTALSTLLPLLHDKTIRAAFDKGMTERPARTFAQAVNALAAGRTDPTVRARVLEAIARFGQEQARSWVSGDPKSAGMLDRLLQARDVPMASRDEWPAVLRDPPWRKKAKAKTEIVLDLQPIETPFRYLREGRLPEHNQWRISRAKLLSDMRELPGVIAELEQYVFPTYYKVPPPSLALPRPEDGEAYALSYLATRIPEIQRARAYALRTANWSALADVVERQPEPLALALWEIPSIHESYYLADTLPHMMSLYGERALPGLVSQIASDPTGLLALARDVDAGDIAPLAARALHKLKKARVPALSWLRAYRETAVMRLIPDAVGKPGPLRDAAELTLRWMAGDREDGRAVIETAAARYAEIEPRATEAVAEVLDRDPLGRFPSRIAKLPGWFAPVTLSRPELKGGGALPDEAMAAIAEMVSFSTPETVYPGIALVREACTPRSLAAFAWDTFSAWLAEGAPSRDGWALRGVGWLGDDEAARQLTRLIRKWPGEAAHARAVTGLDVLVDIGSDVALMNLNGIAEKLKFKGLQDKAREKIAALAEARDLSPDELSDRLAPDLDLDERGGLDLDFGTRRFRASFDEFLKPVVKDTEGVRLKDLPKPNRSDDPELSKQASAQWSALKKDARAVASLQITRLENMLSTSRRVKPSVFWPFFAAHPLIRHLAQRLVWGIYLDADPRTAPSVIFRVADDLSVTDAEDDAIDLDVSEEAEELIGLVHPLQLPPGALDKWGALFGDYEIAQPFPQLGRETYELTDEEKATNAITRFEGIKVEAKRLRGMGARGWPLGSPQDGGAICWIERPVQFLDGKAGTITLDFGDGLFAGAAEFEDKLQTLGKMSTEYTYFGRNQANTRTFGELDRVSASELLRGPSLLVETSTA
ncbi:MAG: dihydrolipoamide acetyltransferase [Mesorhizobium amorphae]|nr:MAG: dihydrolipoamide acetyltransferase [Mesorhizobium amorphae]